MKQTFHKCLLTAVHHKMCSIAFTSVGTNNAKFPVDVVAAALMETCVRFDQEKQLGSIQDIAFIVPPSDETGYLVSYVMLKIKYVIPFSTCDCIVCIALAIQS